MKHHNKINPTPPGSDPSLDKSVLSRLAALKAMSVKDLKTEWEKLIGTSAPNNSRAFLELRIAFRIQELTYGGPDRETRRMLDLLADEVEGHARRKHRIADPRNPVTGTKLNLLGQDFSATGPNQKWAGDISYIWTGEGWLYLAVIIDLYSRRVIGWAVSDRMKRDLAIRALEMAINLRQPPPGCIHHTDRGSQYCSHDYQKILRKHHFQVSMSGKGNCFDNSVVETFFKTIKAELIWRHRWSTRRQVELALFEYINDGVDAPPGGIAMCQNDSCLGCHTREEHPWIMLALWELI